MPAALRFLLAVGTLGWFWFGLFVLSSAKVAPAAATAAVMHAGTADPADAKTASGGTSAGLDAAALDALLVASRDTFVGGQYEESLEPTRALVERFPGQHIYLARLAGIYSKLNRPADEAATWETYMDRSPLPADACPQIGYAYRKLGKFDLALGAFQRCFEADTKNAELAFFVGLANEWMSKFDPAQEYYERAISIASPHYDSEVGLARVRLHRNQLNEALAGALAVLKKVPTHVDGLLVAGLAEQRAGHRREARTYLEKAAKQSADYFDVQLALGILDYSESKFPAARARFELTWKLDAARRDEVQVWMERTSNVKASR